MRRLMATFLGSLLLAAPAVTLACKWSCAEPAMQVGQEACHESPVPEVALTAANACDEHPATGSRGVPGTRVILTLSTPEVTVTLPARCAGPMAPVLTLGQAFSPPKPPLALRL